MTSFSQLSLSGPLAKQMLSNLKELNYNEMTPIQAESIPLVLQGVDVLAQAKTGSGKTAAFGIGLLQNLNLERYRVQGLVLCPTRELAEQVTDELRRLARFRQNTKILTVTGGMPMVRQEQSLRHEVQIVVGTPGRVLKLLERESLRLEEVKMIVLDEADRMLNMGFIDQIKSILSFAPPKRQTLCFSATFPDEIRRFCKRILRNHQEVTVATKHDDTVIAQHFYRVVNAQKAPAVMAVLRQHQPASTLIFCNTKEGVKTQAAELKRMGLYCLALHGDLEQKDRTEVLIRFSNGSSKVLIATDVAARGLDIDDLGAVINLDLPFETETYVHRIGRTGRAGRQGNAFSFATPGEEFRLDAINELLDTDFPLEKASFPLSSKSNSSLGVLEPEMVTLSINGGRKNKISAGDILGALTVPGGIKGTDVGKIDRLDFLTFVAVKRVVAKQALSILTNGQIKGKKFKAMLNS